jgi:pimeloyl-ACP methyl ester carboxylesterase
MQPEERQVRFEGHRLHVREYPGPEPPIVLMHGFPDDLHLYDRMLPHVLPGRRVVTFDFLGWGDSDKPAGYRHTARDQGLQLDAVIDQVGLDEVVLVAHDASGPPAIDWSLAHPDRIAGLVLLNTYYQWTPGLRRPGAIALYSTPILRNAARWVARRFPELDRRLYFWQVGRFIRDPVVRAAIVPEFYGRFRTARPAFWALNDDLLRTTISRRRSIPQVQAFDRPVRIVFGAADPYLNRGVANRFHELFKGSELFLLEGARHYVQVDEPEQVARLILSMPPAGDTRDNQAPERDAEID